MITKMNLDKYRNKAQYIIERMSAEEKIMQLCNKAPENKAAGLKSYNWWNEALHGVARAGIATVFPQAIAMAATFDEELLEQMGDAVSTEGRAKFNEFQKHKDYGAFKGLTFWAPNINIFRDPRWGRGHETYGEDPYLTSRLGVRYIKGLQGNDDAHLKAAACAKHYIAHSGPESVRQGFESKVSSKDLYETYLPAFKACVQQGNVEAVMGAYNSVNGEACCGSRKLIQDILRGELGFKGHFVSDCGAIAEIQTSHRKAATIPEAAALALKSGCDLNCGNAYLHLITALNEGLITEKDIDIALERLLITRFKLGLVEGEKTIYDNIDFSENDSEANNRLSLKAAEECITLLKNDGLLPLSRDSVKKIAVIGPNADSRIALQGNYCGTASKYYTVLDGLREYLGDKCKVMYAQGCHLFKDQVEPCAEYNDRFSEACSVAEHADVVILCVGLDATIEGEQGDAFNADAGGDKVSLELPEIQLKLLKGICGLNKKLIVINLSGSAINLTIAQENANAIIQGWYPGAQGGLALARMIFGEFSPAGRLPVTFYKTVDDLPDFTDYSMKNRTYRYFCGTPLYKFGYGLSYTKFEYSNININKSVIKVGESVTCSVNVRNIGNYDSDEVVQLYLKDDSTSCYAPKYQLKGFKRVHILKGEQVNINFTLSPQDMELVLDDGSCIIEKGTFTVYISGGQPDENDCSPQIQFTVV